jgi:RND family efflux transporter MFP subunit
VAKAGQDQAQAALSQAQTSFNYTQIRSPFDGVVIEKKADSGTFASPGMPIFTVEDARQYRLEASVNENDLRCVRTGRRVSVRIDTLEDGPLKGRVVQIVPAADSASRSFLVKIELPTVPRLHSGLFGRVLFPRGERNALLIPRAAVVERGQLQGMFVLDQNNVASLRYIALGKPSGSTVEVLSGLEEGDRFVAKPDALDLNGKRVQPK